MGRTFSLADEMIFQDAKKDPNAKDIYKILVGLNDVNNFFFI